MKLADGSILSYDLFNSVDNGQNTAERHVPATGQWVAAGTLPVALTSSALGYEMGPAMLLPDGRAFFIGGNGHTALYDPNADSWTQGPDIPNGQHADDAPGCVLANGTVLFAADGTGGANASDTFAPPTNLYVYDPVANTMTQVNNPADLSNRPSFVDRMLALPNGQLLFTDGTGQLFVYSPPGLPAAVAQPAITSINSNSDGTYVLTGTQLNGFSEGAAYGDDAEMSSNYPIIQLTDLANNVYYARSYGWTSTGVDTGSTPVGAEFTLPAGVGPGEYYVSVIANGIASAPVLAILTGFGNDTVTVGVNGLGGVAGNLNGHTFGILPGDVVGVDIVNTGGDDTDNVFATPLGVPLHVAGGGNDTVNLGNGGSVQNLRGNVVIENYSALTTVNVDDSSDGTARTVTLSTVVLADAGVGDLEPDTDLAGQIGGLAPATITYEYYDTGSVSIRGGTGGNLWYIRGTGVTTNLFANGYDTVNVGNSGSVQGIVGVLNLQDEPSFITLRVDDSADSTARTVTLSTFTGSGSEGDGDSDLSGAITGLAPASINYEYLDTSSVTIHGGTAGNTWYMLGTGVTTDLFANGHDTVNVGNSGSVQGIVGVLNLQDEPSFITLRVDDSADSTARTVTLSTFTGSGSEGDGDSDLSGAITGLAPASINYEYLDTSSVTIYGGSGGSTWNVLGTGVTTNLFAGGFDTVNVGAAGILGIVGWLNLQDEPSFIALNVNNSAGTTPRTVTLSTVLGSGNEGDGDSDLEGAITGSGACRDHVRISGHHQRDHHRRQPRRHV